MYLYFNTVFVDQQVCNHPGARQQTFVTLGTLISRFVRLKSAVALRNLKIEQNGTTSVSFRGTIGNLKLDLI